MAEEDKKPFEKDFVDGNSHEDIRELMQRFNVSEEDVNVAIQIVGNQREKLEQFLVTKRSSRFYDIW